MLSLLCADVFPPKIALRKRFWLIYWYFNGYLVCQSSFMAPFGSCHSSVASVYDLWPWCRQQSELLLSHDFAWFNKTRSAFG